MNRIALIFSCFLTAAAWGQEAYTLETIVSRVLEQNFNVRIERNNVAIAENNNNIANAGYLPTIGVTADKNWNSTNTRQEFFSGQINEKDGAKNTSTNALLLMNWTFFDGFRMFAADQRLQAEEDLAGLYLTAEMEMNIYQAAALYYTILQQQQLTPVYEQALELSNARYDLVELKVKNGAGTELQLIQARLDLTADSSVLLQHNKQLADLKVDLNTLMGQPASTPIELSGTLIPNTGLTWESAFEQAKGQNTQLLLNKSAIAIAELQQKEVRSAYYPQLSFYTQFAYATQQNQVGLLNSSRSYGPGAGFTLRWTILDRLSTYTNLKNSRVMIQNAELVAQQQEQFIEAELRKTFNEYLWAKQNLELEQQTILNTEETFRITEQAFQNGAITALELREIQFSVIQAQSRLLAAQLALKTAELNISLTTGGFKNLLQ
jgi:outer membrane protein